jgi:hypothetical protein
MDFIYRRAFQLSDISLRFIRMKIALIRIKHITDISIPIPGFGFMKDSSSLMGLLHHNFISGRGFLRNYTLVFGARISFSNFKLHRFIGY